MPLGIFPSSLGQRTKRAIILRRDAVAASGNSNHGSSAALAAQSSRCPRCGPLAFRFSATNAAAMPFASQAQLFAQADVIVGAHGAGLVNMMFLRPGRHRGDPPVRARPDLLHAHGRKLHLWYHAVVADEVDAGTGSLAVNAGRVAAIVARAVEDTRGPGAAARGPSAREL